MKAIIGSVHRAGSNYLASVLDQAVSDHTIEGEDFKTISKYKGEKEGFKSCVQSFIDSKPENYIHISPQFTYLLKDLEVDKIAFLIRDPYSHALSKINLDERWKDVLLGSLISDIELFYGYIAKSRNKIFKYEDLDKKGIEEVAKYLGLKCDLREVNLSKGVNRSNGNFKSLDSAINDKAKLKQLMTVIKKYQKRFKY